MKEIVDALIAFHLNGASNLAYILSTNWWFLLIVGGCICTAVMNWREQKATVVREEQNIL